MANFDDLLKKKTLKNKEDKAQASKEVDMKTRMQNVVNASKRLSEGDDEEKIDKNEQLKLKLAKAMEESKKAEAQFLEEYEKESEIDERAARQKEIEERRKAAQAKLDALEAKEADSKEKVSKEKTSKENTSKEKAVKKSKPKKEETKKKSLDNLKKSTTKSTKSSTSKTKKTEVKEVIKEVIKEVPVEVIKEVVKEVPVEKIVEKKVEVPVEVIKEVVKEVPVEKIVEKKVEVPVEKIVEKEVIKEVVKEVPVEKIIEKKVEVPVEVIKEVVKEVPVEKIVEKKVEVPVEKIVEKEVIKEVVKEVPVEKIIEKKVEVPKEIIKEVTVEKIVEVPVEIVKEVVVEKKVEVPVEKEIIKEVIKEVPTKEGEKNQEVVDAKKSKKVLDFFMKTMNGMAFGLFATLIIGTILDTVAKIPLGDGFTSFLTTLANVLKLSLGAGIGIGVAYSMGFRDLKLISLGLAGFIASYMCGSALDFFNIANCGVKVGDPLTIYLTVIVVGLLMKLILKKKTPVDIIIVPLFASLIAGLLAFVTSPAIIFVTTGIGKVIEEATNLHPFIMGIIIAVVMGMALTAPISSAAIAAAVLTQAPLAGGAAVVGCCVQMLGFAVQSIRDNKVGTVISIGLGTSMLQFKNILKRPVIWLPTIIASAILGPIATCVLKTNCLGVNAGMGTSGLVGVIGTISAMEGNTLNMVLSIVLLEFVLPILLVFALDALFRALKWIRKGDLEV